MSTVRPTGNIRRKSDGFGVFDVFLICLIIGLLGFIGVYVFKHHVRKTVSNAVHTTSGRSTAKTSLSNIPTIGGGNWSGYVAGPAGAGISQFNPDGTSTPAPPFNYIQAEFTLPESFSCEDPNNAISIWVGLDGAYGGEGNDTVEQPGAIVECNPDTKKVDYTTFSALDGTKEDYVTHQLKVGPGDHVFASMRYTNNEFYSVIKNLTAGTQWTGHQPCNSNVPCRRASAEWIVENLNTNGGGYLSASPQTKASLGKFPPILFSNAYASEDGGGLRSISALTLHRYYLTGSGVDQPALDKVNSLNAAGNSFTISWLRQ